LVAPSTSVLIPVWNSHATVRAAVESALAQTAHELEVLVIDDASDPPIADALADVRDARLRLLRHRRNRGPAAARNTGVKNTRAPLVSHLDSDDLWEPDYLESVLPCFEDPAVGLAYTNATIVGHPDGLDTYIPDASVHPMDRFPKIAEQNPIPSLTATIRKHALQQVGGYAPWLRIAEDYHVYLKLARAGWRFAYVDRKLARYTWPTSHGALTFDHAATDRYLGRMWWAFALRHPLTPGPRRQVRTRLQRRLASARGRIWRV
jgi:cellulose synthase/poly-beta-1,6-N-acetylglucosamine synthase-like glycosyltransferase